MTQAKPPDKEGTWESIDIFLFTNGQQYSPPRKYHLCADELTLWDATLSHLAQSQLGTMHPALQLHTLDGHMVEGPLELSNGGAYVAVEPPDAFIVTGYEKYLIKASRSWEKRQARKSSIEILPDANPITDEDPKPNVNASDVMSIKPPEENSTDESVTNPPIKPTNVSEVPQHAPKPPPATKQVDRKRTSLSQRVTTFKKVTNPPPTTAANKLAIKASPPKKFTKPSLPIRTPNTPEANMSSKPRIQTKTVFKAKENIPTWSKKEDRKSTSITRVTSNYNIMTADSTPVENIIGDKELILVSNLYKNLESDSKSMKIDSTIKKEQAGVQYSPEIITIDEETQSVIDQTSETAQGRVSIQKGEVRNSKVTIVNITTDSKNLLSNNPVDDNNVTFMNKGDVVNLKLMIEVRNVDSRNEKYKRACKSQSGTNTLRPQKESQNNIDDEVLIQCKSLQSALENEYCQNMLTDVDPKVVVVRCGCRQYENDNSISCVNASSMHTYNRRYFILLPKWEECVDRCRCDEDTKQNVDKCERKEQESEKTSKITPVKEKSSDISLVRIIVHKNNEQKPRSTEIEASVFNNYYILPEVSNITNIGNSPNSEYSNANTERAKDEYVVAKQKDEVAVNQILESGAPTSQRSSVVSERSEYIVRRKGSLKEAKTYVDNWTQTESSDILLEARHHEDGRYTFHLPSLYTLKLYQL